MTVTLDGKSFSRRISNIIVPDDMDSIVICVGAAQDDGYSKSTALQMYLLGFEFPETLMAVLKDGNVVFLTSQKKASIIDTLGVDNVTTFKRSKDADENEATWNQIAEMLGSNIGVFTKDTFEGKFYKEYKKYITATASDITEQFSVILSIKDESELKLVKTASRVSSLVMKNYIISELESILDDDRKISHMKFTENIEGVLEESHRKRLKITSDASFDLMDFCYPPIIQSGGKFELKPSVESNKDYLHAGVIICSIGIKYKSYCTNIARTFLIDPEKQKEKNYKFLLELQDYTISIIKPGTTCKDVYSKCLALVEKKRPDLKENLTKNLGFSMGLEFRESLFVLGPKSSREIKEGMIFNVAVGFSGIQNPDATDSKDKVYALLVIDTIQVLAASSVLLTDVTKDVSDVSYIFKEPEVDGAAAAVAPGNESQVPLTRASKNPSAVLPSKMRAEKDGMSNEQKRREHQKELADLKQADGLSRFSKDGVSGEPGSNKVQFKKFASYKKETQIPNETREMRVLVDRRNQSIVLPIYGLAVPFHITTLKNLSKSEDRDFIHLRFNFQTPAQSLGKKDPTSIPYEDPDATFVRAITFKSTDVHRFNEIFREVNDLKKEMQKMESERKEMRDLVAQDKLIEVRGKRPVRLNDIFVRPALEGKKFPGEVEIHVNGLRYMSQVRNDQKIDILFSNIKHLFFQPCNHELLVLIHIHLKDAIMIGKKKTVDIQFYREVVDANYDETGNKRRRHNYGDEDELVAEQEERKLRSQLNKEFKEFAGKITELSKDHVSVDVPYRDLSFHGVPFRQLVLMQPSTDCLVHLTDPPFVVMTLADIEIVHLERVQFGLKNFDMVVVFKDFQKTPAHINSIPMDQIENVKEWLDSVDVAFTEGPVNLSWPQIMKTINEDPSAFFQEGGWGFLQMDGDDEDESESASEFEGSDAGFGGSVASESDSGGSGSGFSEGGSDDGSGDDDESGEDWDDLEKEAARKDEKKRGAESDSDDGRGKKRR